MPPSFNRTVLMSGADYMNNSHPINSLMQEYASQPFDVAQAMREHQAIRLALEHAGVEVVTTPAPPDCQDGVFTANWALTKGGKAVMSSLPNFRKAEEAYAHNVLEGLGLELFSLPNGIKFSGQGDAVPCGDYVFMGTGFRTDPEAHDFVAQKLGYNVISLHAIPELDSQGQPVINQETGWPDSPFYDHDLVVSALRPAYKGQKGLIAWCPDALIPESQELMRSLDFVDKIEVPFDEARHLSACNLVSTGDHVVMNAGTTILRAALLGNGFTLTELHNEELAKNGGSVRCTTLTLDNA